MSIKQSVNTSARNINLEIDTDYPSFDLIINGYKYETNTNSKERGASLRNLRKLYFFIFVCTQHNPKYYCNAACNLSQ